VAASVPAFVNRSLLEWAREEAGYAPADAARKVNVALEKLLAWEDGTAQPTLRQAEALAKLYERPLSVFALPAPPQLAPLSTEYRRLPGVIPGEESPELRRAVRRLVQRRRIALHLYAEMGDEPVEFPLRAKLHEDPENVGLRIRATLGISLESQLAWPSEFAAYRAWRDAVERLGVLVCQFPGKGVGDIRGTSIVHFPLPVAGVSSKEIPLSKPFTLLHESVHLALAASREEQPALTEKRTDADWLQVERFCESAASAVLMPKDAITADPDVRSQRTGRTWEVSVLRRIARRYKVTPSAAATRLLWLGIMSTPGYAAWKQAWQSYRDAHPDRPSFGIATPAEKAVGRSGPLLTSLVLSALSSDRISSVDATNYLDVGYDHVEKLRQGWLARPQALAGVTAE
jgi:Zn-dependent peptidase ImmA (M78 family)/DNA-binding XRE family transcriptional regulator